MERTSPNLSRRDILKLGAASMLPAALGAVFGASPELQASQHAFRARHRVILLWLRGGPSQLETFDPAYNGGPDVKGDFRHVGAPGFHCSETLGRTAALLNRCAVLRAVNTGSNDHETGTEHFLRPGNVRSVRSREETMGVRLTRGSERIPYAVIEMPGGDGLAVRDAHEMNKSELSIPAGKWNPRRRFFDPPDIRVDPDLRLEARAPLLRNIDNHPLPPELERAHGNFRNRAYALLGAEGGRIRRIFEASACDIGAVHERYGNSEIGVGMHLAIELTRRDVQFVTIHANNFDQHNAIFPGMLEINQKLDPAISGALRTFEERRIRDTLLIVGGEFGRTPEVRGRSGRNAREGGPGRDHYREGTAILLAGGDIEPGTFAGRTNPRTGEPVEQIGLPEALNTMYAAAGAEMEEDAPVVQQVLRRRRR